MKGIDYFKEFIKNYFDNWVKEDEFFCVKYEIIIYIIDDVVNYIFYVV